MIRRLLARLRRDPVESTEEFLQRLEDEARRNQATDAAFARAHRDPVVVQIAGESGESAAIRRDIERLQGGKVTHFTRRLRALR